MFIGEKKIKTALETEERTPGGASVIEVEYEDGTYDRFSSFMFNNIQSEEACDLSALRDKRMSVVVPAVLGILRDYGVKIGELPYFSILLNQSLNNNADQASISLWSKYLNKPQSLDDIDLIAVDRVLKELNRSTLKDVLEG